MSNGKVSPKYSWSCDKKFLAASALSLGVFVGLGFVTFKWLQAESLLGESRSQNQELEAKITELELTQEQRKETRQENEHELKKKIEELEAGKKALASLIGSKNRGMRDMRQSVALIVESLQDVYAIKYESNNPVLQELENTSQRSAEVRKKWEEICTLLESEGGFEKEVALLRLRIAQSCMAAGQWQKADIAKINWEAAGLKERKADIMTRLYYGLAVAQMDAGKRKEAEESLQKCLNAASQIAEGSESMSYAQAMANMLQAKLQISDNPAVALKHYIAAIGHLRQVVVEVPNNVRLRCTFTQACMDGALMTAGGESAGWSEKLRNEAHGHAFWLVKNHPELELGHELCAENDIFMAEKKLRDGEIEAVEPYLQRAEKSLLEIGGNARLESSITGVRAFLQWDKGERETAAEMMARAISSMQEYSMRNPEDAEAKFRLASLLWERSAMRMSKSESIEDGRLAALKLADLVKQGAGRRESAARRMIAIIFGDIGHMAAESGQKEKAKQYFQSARDQWSYLSSKWGECDEYREGMRWCTSRLNSL